MRTYSGLCAASNKYRYLISAWPNQRSAGILFQKCRYFLNVGIWRIEDLHKILKSTCKVEDFQYKTADRLMRAIAISLVVAWRILYISCLSKINTEIHAEKVFTKQQINLLRRIARKNKKKDPINLRLAIHLIASFGGYEERNKYEPGYLSIGYGLVKFIGCLNLLSEC